MRIKPLDSLSTVKVRALLVQLLSESIIFSRQYRIFSAEGDNRNQSSSTATSSYGFDQRSLVCDFEIVLIGNAGFDPFND